MQVMNLIFHHVKKKTSEAQRRARKKYYEKNEEYVRDINKNYYNQNKENI